MPNTNNATKPKHPTPSKCQQVKATLIDSFIEANASLFGATGKFGCVLAGAGFAITYTLNKKLQAAYFGAIHATSNITIGLSMEEQTYLINNTKNLHYDKELNDQRTYYLTDWLNPYIFLEYCSIFIVVGIILQIISANLTHWQTYRTQNAHYDNTAAGKLLPPSKKEYLYLNAQSLFSSLTYGLLSLAIAGSYIQYSGLYGKRQNYTYPPTGPHNVNGTYYTGPIETKTKSIDLQMNQSISFEAPIQTTPHPPSFFTNSITISQTIDANLAGEAESTFGAGIELSSEDTTPPPVALSITTGVMAYLGSNFFAKKQKALHNERLAPSAPKQSNTIAMV